MKQLASLIASSLLLAGASTGAVAESVDVEKSITEKKFIVAVKTDDLELQELDISHLQPGDSETIVTESGKTIDLLRTEDDVEIYVDGEMLDIGTNPADHHDAAGNVKVHKVRKTVEVICDDEDNCDEMVWISEDGDQNLHEIHHDGDEEHDGKKVYIIKKEVITD